MNNKFPYGVSVNPVLIIFLSLTKLLTFPSLVYTMAGFNLSCSNNPHKNFSI